MDWMRENVEKFFTIDSSSNVNTQCISQDKWIVEAICKCYDEKRSGKVTHQEGEELVSPAFTLTRGAVTCLNDGHQMPLNSSESVDIAIFIQVPLCLDCLSFN